MTIENYINSFTEDVQQRLWQIYKTIKQTAPHAAESFSYGMPAFKTEGKPLVYFAAYKNHIGFYPTPSGLDAFKDEISAFKNSKGAVQFPLDRDLPLDLISRIVSFRIKENYENAVQKNPKKS